MEPTFKIESHHYRDSTNIVDIKIGGKLVATIYPIENGIRLISSYISNELVCISSNGTDCVNFVFQTQKGKL